MKKLFLTSGLAIMIAGSAFATANDINYDGTTTPPSYNLANNAGNPACKEPTLGTYTEDTTFYAKWQAKQYHINYIPGTARNLNGDTSSAHIHTPVTPANAVTQQTATFDSESPAILGNMFTAPAGYTFGGWKGNYDDEGTATAYNDATHAGGTSYAVDSTIDPYQVAGDLTLTATWTPIDYTVTYDKGAHAASGVNNYTDTNGAQYDKNYTAKTGGGANAAASTTGIYAAPGYTFRGWSRTSNSTYATPTGTQTEATANPWLWSGETPWHDTAALTVYAIYSANPYKITYYPGKAKTALYNHDVQGTATEQDVTFDASVTLKDNTAADLTGGAWAQTGYTFYGWRSDHNILTNATPALTNDNTAGGWIYLGGASTDSVTTNGQTGTGTALKYKVPGGTKMYAIWNPNKSGKITLDSSVYPSNNFSATAKYTTETQESVNPVNIQEVFSVYETALYDFSTANTSSPTVVSSFVKPSIRGYIFNGFYESNGSTQVISDTGAIINDNALRSVSAVSGTKTWYAKWTPEAGKITYSCGTKPDGASTNVSGTAPAVVNLNFDEGYQLVSSLTGTQETPCSLPGYHFKGWICDHNIDTGEATSTTYDGTGSVNTWTLSKSGTFKVVGEIICRVHWEANTITTNWNANGGTLTNNGQPTCTFDSTLGIPTTIPTRDGYDFNGWTTTAPVVQAVPANP